MRECKFSYDKEQDDLLLYLPDSKSKGSIELGDFILDYDCRKNVVGIQIMNVSSFLGELYETGELQRDEDILENLSKALIEVKRKNKAIFIKLHLFGKGKEVKPTITMPSIVDSSPALAFC